MFKIISSEVAPIEDVENYIQRKPHGGKPDESFVKELGKLMAKLKPGKAIKLEVDIGEMSMEAFRRWLRSDEAKSARDRVPNGEPIEMRSDGDRVLIMLRGQLTGKRWEAVRNSKWSK